VQGEGVGRAILVLKTSRKFLKASSHRSWLPSLYGPFPSLSFSLFIRAAVVGFRALPTVL
jgi:hypothetical protein